MAFGVLREADALQRVRPDRHLVVQRQFLLHVAIEGRAGQPDHHNHHADVDRCSRRSAACCGASAAHVAASRFCPVCREITPAPRRNSDRMAVHHRRRKRKRHQRIEVARVE